MLGRLPERERALAERVEKAQAHLGVSGLLIPPLAMELTFKQLNMKRLNIKQILQNPQQRKELFVGVIQFLQNIEGIDTTREQAETAYDKVRGRS